MAGRVASGQRLRFFEHRGRRVAVATVGDGPPLLCDLGRLHHLDVFWRYPPYRHLIEALARDFTVIRFDRPGCGLSDRAEADFTVGGDLALFDRIVHELRLDRLAVLAWASSAPPMIALAALRPDQVSRLALVAPRAYRPPEVHGYSDALDSLVRTQFPLAVDVMINRAAEICGCSPAAVRWMSAAYRQVCSGHVMAQFLRESVEMDVGPMQGRVRCPTLVLHRREDRMIDFQQARDVAARIRDAVLLPIDGAESIVWEGDQEALLGPLVRFLTDAVEPGVTATVLTAREREIARLVTEGLSNAEIGERLGIRRRTVESHLERVRSKLGLLSRTDLAAWTVRSLVEHP